MAYTSNIDLKLGESPKTDDPKLFGDLVDIYNAIHLLSQYVDNVRETTSKGSGEEGTPPEESLPFDKWIWATAYHNISAGMICTLVNTQRAWSGGFYSVEGVVRGAGTEYAYTQPSLIPPTQEKIRRSVGGTYIALSDASPGQQVKLGIGPGVLKLDGLAIGEPVYSKAWADPTPFEQPQLYILNNDGGVYRLPENATNYITDGLIRVGYGIAPGRVLLIPPEAGVPF